MSTSPISKPKTNKRSFRQFRTRKVNYPFKSLEKEDVTGWGVRRIKWRRTYVVVESENKSVVPFFQRGYPVKLWKLKAIAFERYPTRATFNSTSKQSPGLRLQTNRGRKLSELEFVLRRRVRGNATATRVKPRVVRVARKVGNLRQRSRKMLRDFGDIGWK